MLKGFSLRAFSSATFGLLLGMMVAWLVDRIGDLLPQWSISARVVFFLFLLALTLGAGSLAARQQDSRLPALPNIPTPGVLGFTEQRMVLVAVAVVLWLFVVLQISYMFHEPPGVVGSGTTFAEYARRGFAQLSVAVTLVGGLILVLEATRAPDLDSGQRRLLVRLEAVRELRRTRTGGMKNIPR